MKRRLAVILVTDMFGYSRLMEVDEDGIIDRQNGHRQELIDLKIKSNSGNIKKDTGDGLLVTFKSVTDAVRAAIDIQMGMLERESDSSEEERIQYRMGINVGDILFDKDDVFGHGVNVAARLEGLAEPGGVCISDAAYQMMKNSDRTPFNDLGLQTVKNISRPIRVWQWTPNTPARDIKEIKLADSQRIQFCTTPDGVRLAYAKVGNGPSLLKAPNWLSHLDYEWRAPIWGPLLEELAREHELVRFDHRGGGLSDWEVEDITVERMISDMSTVVEAAELEKFALFGISQGCAFSIQYAVENPDKVRCLILFGGYARGRLKRNSPKQERLFEAGQTMIQEDWGSPNSVYCKFFTSVWLPDATPEQQNGLDELQRVSLSAENAVRMNHMSALGDVTDLARKISVPTLVLHCEGDQVVPPEEGRRMADLIPNAKFVPLKGGNHAVVSNVRIQGI